ncbi:MAG: hypothetical protein ACRD0H_07720, partial [Actinomycetes bacterium]
MPVPVPVPVPGGRSDDRASLERLIGALASGGVWYRVVGDRVEFRCPLPDHPDRAASAGANWEPPGAGKPGRVVLLCHRCGREATDQVVAELGLTWSDLFDDPP